MLINPGSRTQPCLGDIAKAHSANLCSAAATKTVDAPSQPPPAGQGEDVTRTTFFLTSLPCSLAGYCLGAGGDLLGVAQVAPFQGG